MDDKHKKIKEGKHIVNTCYSISCPNILCRSLNNSNREAPAFETEA